MLKKKVLIVDSVTKFLPDHDLFNNAGIRTFTAFSNDEVLDVHRRHKMDLIIHDTDLHGMSSARLCHTIREDKAMRDVFMIAVCSNERSAKEVDATCQVDSIFVKPLRPELVKLKAYQFLTVYPRASYRTAVTITVKNREETLSFLGKSENMSATGMLLQSDKVLYKDDLVTCSFFLPNGTRIRTGGRVVRYEPHPLTPGLHRYGIKFAHTSRDTRFIIDSFVRTWTQFSNLSARQHTAQPAGARLWKPRFYAG